MSFISVCTWCAINTSHAKGSYMEKIKNLWLGEANRLTINLAMTLGANIFPFWFLLCGTLEPLIRKNPKKMLVHI